MHPWIIFVVVCLTYSHSARGTKSLIEVPSEYEILDFKQGEIFDRIEMCALDNEDLISPEARIYLKAYHHFLDLVLRDDHSGVDSFLALSEKLQSWESPDEKGESMLALQAENALHQGILSMYFGQELKTIRKLNQSQKKFEEVLRIDPSDYRARRGDAALKIVVSALPDALESFVKGLTALEGNSTLGFKILEEVCALDHPLQGESMAIWSLLSPTQNEKKRVAERMRILFDEDCSQVGLGMFLADVLLKTRQSVTASNILYQLQSSNLPPRVLYYQALIELYEGNTQESYRLFQSFISQGSGSLFFNDALSKMYWSTLLDEHLMTDRTLVPVKNPIADADKVALYELQSTQQQNVAILRARMRMDGGFFDQAVQILESMDTASLTSEWREEWLYRSARALHMDGRYEEASAKYNTLLTEYNTSKQYYTCSGAIHWAEILISSGEEDTDICPKLEYALDRKPARYKRSLYQKAKLLSERHCRATRNG